MIFSRGLPLTVSHIRPILRECGAREMSHARDAHAAAILHLSQTRALVTLPCSLYGTVSQSCSLYGIVSQSCSTWQLSEGDVSR